MKAGVCPLCGQRKGKRYCPAKAASICSTCCGTKRLVEIDCPSDCQYLTGAHAPAWEGRDDERRRDAMRLTPHIQALSEDQAAVFLYLLTAVSRVTAKHRDADDVQWQQAIAALHKTLDTRESGLVYEHPTEGWRSQELLREMQALIHPPKAEGRPIAPPSILRPAVAALDAALTAAIAENAGSRAFLETAARMTAAIGAKDTPAPESDPAPRIVEP